MANGGGPQFWSRNFSSIFSRFPRLGARYSSLWEVLPSVIRAAHERSRFDVWQCERKRRRHGGGEVWGVLFKAGNHPLVGETGPGRPPAPRGGGKGGRAAVGKFGRVPRGNDQVPGAEPKTRLGDPPRLVGIDRRR